MYQPLDEIDGDHPFTYLSVNYHSEKAKRFHESEVRETLRENTCLTDRHGFGHRTVAVYVYREAAERDADRVVSLNLPNVTIQIGDNQDVWDRPPPPFTAEQLQRALDRGRA
jgi:hypothetical protein